MSANVIRMPLAMPRADDVESSVPTERSRLERCLGILVPLRAGEGRSVLLFFGYAFLLLVCYYVLKLLREPLLLAGGSAELKSYAQAAIALALMLLVPLYGLAFRRTARAELVRAVTACFAASLALFYLLGRAGFDVGFAYYVWVGVFGVTMLAQFWAHAAHSFDVASGQRLFPAVMAGATLGGLAGPPLVSTLFPLLGAWNLLLLALGLLVATLPLVTVTCRAVPAAARNRRSEEAEAHSPAWNGFGLVARDRYLLLLAMLVVVLNCVNTTGEYLLTHLILQHVDAELAAQPSLDRSALIAGFYGGYYLAVNALTVVLQLFLVGRVFRWLGIHGALLVLPVIALLGYGLLVCVPIFALIRLVKIVENSVDYSVMSTARHALFLPLPAAQQYQGKTAIEGFFWRLGDVAHAIVIYAGLHWLGLGLREFALLNFGLAVVWIGLATSVARLYAQRVACEPSVARRRIRGRVAAIVAGLAGASAAANVAAAPEGAPRATVSVVAAHEPAASLFATHAPLELELKYDAAQLCRNPQGDGCEDAAATLIHRLADGEQQRLAVTLRSRGRWRKDTADCSLPALFVFFGESAAGTPFAGDAMLPLTTHCRKGSRSYEQYVLKEYLAYRILNVLTDKSLRVRLVRIAYHDTDDPKRAALRYGFFTEHFDSLARRHGAEVWRPEMLDLERVSADELATLALFQFLIGNTDWSAVYGHNVVAIRDAAGTVSAVPYDFDFSGLVDASYAGPPPGLPIRSVRQRVFRGFCRPQPDWSAVFTTFSSRRDEIVALIGEIPGLEVEHARRVAAYVASFFDVISSAERRNASVVAACR